MTFLIDGAPVRTVKAADAKGKFPQTPMRLKLGIWAGGDASRTKDQVSWAGGVIDWSKAPYEAVIDSVKIVNYNPAEQYRYKDQSGTWQSIDIIGGNPGGVNRDPEPETTSTNQGMMVNQVSKPDTSSSSSAAPASTTSAPSNSAPPKIGTPQQSTALSNATSSKSNATSSVPANTAKSNSASSSPLAITPLIALCVVALHFVL
jgi:hypothetical protein